MKSLKYEAHKAPSPQWFYTLRFSSLQGFGLLAQRKWWLPRLEDCWSFGGRESNLKNIPDLQVPRRQMSFEQDLGESISIWDMVQLIFITERCWCSRGNTQDNEKSNRRYSIKSNMYLGEWGNTENMTMWSFMEQTEMRVKLVFTWFCHPIFSSSTHCSFGWERSIWFITTFIPHTVSIPPPQSIRTSCCFPHLYLIDTTNREPLLDSLCKRLFVFVPNYSLSVSR